MILPPLVFPGNKLECSALGKPFQYFPIFLGKARGLPFNGARVFVPGKPLQPSLMFLGEAGAYPSEAPFRCSTLG